MRSEAGGVEEEVKEPREARGHKEVVVVAGTPVAVQDWHVETSVEEDSVVPSPVGQSLHTTLPVKQWVKVGKMMPIEVEVQVPPPYW